MNKLSKNDKLSMRKSWMRTLFDNPNNFNFGDRDIILNNEPAIELSFFEQKNKFELYIRNRYLSPKDSSFEKEKHLLKLFAELMIGSFPDLVFSCKEEGRFQKASYMFYFDSFDKIEEVIDFSFELLEDALQTLEDKEEE